MTASKNDKQNVRVYKEYVMYSLKTSYTKNSSICLDGVRHGTECQRYLGNNTGWFTLTPLQLETPVGGQNYLDLV